MSILRKPFNNRGLSMVEVMVSAAILALVALPLLNMFANSTALVVKTNEKAKDTYVAKAQIEGLYGLDLNALMAKTMQRSSDGRSVDGSGNLNKLLVQDTIDTTKWVSLSAVPTGNLDRNLWSDASKPPVYAYLIVTKDNSIRSLFVGPEGILRNISNTGDMDGATFSTSTAGDTYSLSKGSTVFASGKKPAGRPLVLIVNSVSVINPGASTADKAFILNASGSMFVQHYKPIAMDAEGYQHDFKVIPSGGANPRVYRNDNRTPTTILFTVACSVYASHSTAQPPVSNAQNTLEVSIGT